MFPVFSAPYVQTKAFVVIDSSIFCNFTATSPAFLVQNPTFSLELKKSRFDDIVCDSDLLFNYNQGLNCTIFMTCFHRTASNIVSAFSITSGISGRARYSSIILTSESVCGLGRSTHASYSSGENECIFFHNNFSGISVKSYRSGFSLEYSPFVEGTTGFAQAANCEGGALIASYLNQNQLYEKMNLLNSSVLAGRGLFALCYTSFKTMLKDFIIESKEQRIWIDTVETYGNPTLVLVSCKILGYQPPPSNRVTHLVCRKWKVLCPTKSKGMIGFFVEIIRLILRLTLGMECSRYLFLLYSCLYLCLRSSGSVLENFNHSSESDLESSGNKFVIYLFDYCLWSK